jgi:hypothetical protein
MQAGGLTALAAGVYGAAALGQQATASGSDIEGLLFQSGGVAVALGVGWWLIRRSDVREDRAAAAAAALLDAEKAAHEHTRAQLVEETARRMAAERLIDRRHRGDTRPEET